jgi:hypothetical protein
VKTTTVFLLVGIICLWIASFDEALACVFKTSSKHDTTNYLISIGILDGTGKMQLADKIVTLITLNKEAEFESLGYVRKYSFIRLAGCECDCTNVIPFSRWTQIYSQLACIHDLSDQRAASDVTGCFPAIDGGIGNARPVTLTGSVHVSDEQLGAIGGVKLITSKGDRLPRQFSLPPTDKGEHDSEKSNYQCGNRREIVSVGKPFQHKRVPWLPRMLLVAVLSGTLVGWFLVREL